MSESLAVRWHRIHARIEQACRRAGRSASTVTLVGVTKTVEASRIRDALALGLADLGENRVQEARTKQSALQSLLRAQGSGLGVVAQSPQPRAQSAVPVRWHLIGHLQRNKVQEALELFDAIHSVDSLELIDELERRAAIFTQGSGLRAQGTCPEPPAQSLERVLEVFVQVNISGETTKHGCRPEETETLARRALDCQHVRLAGFMTIAPFSDDPESSRPVFRSLRSLRDRMAVALHLDPSTLNLSMGMSGDFDVAIEEGADVIRIGTALFGARDGA